MWAYGFVLEEHALQTPGTSAAETATPSHTGKAKADCGERAMAPSAILSSTHSNTFKPGGACLPHPSPLPPSPVPACWAAGFSPV